MLKTIYRRYKAKTLLYKLVGALKNPDGDFLLECITCCEQLLKTCRFTVLKNKAKIADMTFTYRLKAHETPIVFSPTFDTCTTPEEFSCFIGNPNEKELESMRLALIDSSTLIIGLADGTIAGNSNLRKHYWNSMFIIACTVNLFSAYEWEPIK